MKQNITLALDREVLLAARVFAAQQGISVSAMLAEELREKWEKTAAMNIQNRLRCPCSNNLGRSVDLV